MNRTDFIKELRSMADALEDGAYKFLDLEGGSYFFCNKNFGEITCKLSKDVSMNLHLYTATDEEKKEKDLLRR